MSTFHVFPNLPTELRLLIWEHSMQPRIVAPVAWKDVTNYNVKERGHFCPTIHPNDKVYFRTPTPTILYVCRESRFVGEKHYRKSFLCHGSRHPTILRLPCDFIWLNFDIDIVQLSLHEILDGPFVDPENHLIQRIQVACDDLDMDWFINLGPRLGNFDRLKSVDFIFDAPYDLDYDWHTFLAGPEEAYNWGCGPAIVRVINKSTGEVLDYERDKEMVGFDEDPRNCPDTCVHVGPHDREWVILGGSWYSTIFGDL